MPLQLFPFVKIGKLKRIISLLVLGAFITVFFASNAAAQIVITGPSGETTMEQTLESGEKVPLPSYTYSGYEMLQQVWLRADRPVYGKPGTVFEYTFQNKGAVYQAYIDGGRGLDENGNPAFSSAGNGIDNYGTIQTVRSGNYNGGRTWLTNREDGFVGHMEGVLAVTNDGYIQRVIANNYNNQSGIITNQGSGMIDTAGAARIINKDNAFIGGVGGGAVLNQDKAGIGTVMLNNPYQYQPQPPGLQNKDEASIGTFYLGYRTEGGPYGNPIYTPEGVNYDPQYGPQAMNFGNASIGDAHINGIMVNTQNATIGSVDLVRAGLFTNEMNASIGTARVSDLGLLTNTGNATIESATVVGTAESNDHSGSRNSILNTGNASIGTLSVQAAKVVNEAAIGNASVQINGLLNNVNGSVDTASIAKNGQVNNGQNGTIGTVSVKETGVLDNGTMGLKPNENPSQTSNAFIDTVSVTGQGKVTNHDYAAIGTMSITGNGSVQNTNSAYIDNISVDGNGSTVNVSNQAGIGEANVFGWGQVNNVSDENVSGRIEKISVSGNGSVGNSGTIGRANISDWGGIANGGTVDSAVVSGGFFDNAYNANVSNLRQDSGAITNGGRIENMTYTDGNYNTTGGTIGMLSVAGDFEAGENWGHIEKLVFADDGLGTLIIKAFAEPEMQTIAAFSSFQAAETAPAKKYTFSSMDGIDSIDATNGSARLDLSAFGANETAFMEEFVDGFSIPAILGMDKGNVIGFFDSVEVFMGDEVEMGAEMIEFMSAGLRTNGMSYVQTNTGGVLSFVAEPSTPAPEPASLVILGLGLAGLGLARRHRK